MNSDRPTTVLVRQAGHPFFRVMVAFPIAFFFAALLTDLAYVGTADMFWSDFSDWLLLGGVITGFIAAIAGLGALASRRRDPARPRRPVGIVILGSVIVLALGVLNNLEHSHDAWTSVMPYGLALSGITAVVVILTAWAGFRAPAVVAEAVAGPGYGRGYASSTYTTTVEPRI
jgi:uncharacterized membrane protein